MTKWNSLAEISREFGLEPGTDAGVLRTSIKKLMSSLHPDKNGGIFVSEDDKALFMQAKAALEFIEEHSHTGLAMIPVSELPAIVTAVSQAMNLQSSQNSHILESAYISDAKMRISKQFTLPKFGSGIFAGITAFLMTFPEKFAKHPILGPYLEKPSAQMILLMLTIYSAFFFVLAWYRERKSEARAEYLLSESSLPELFEILRDKPLIQPNGNRVSSRDITMAVHHLAGYRQHRLPLFLGGVGSYVDLQTLEKVSKIQTQRLVERKVLTPIGGASLDTWYEIQNEQHGMPNPSFNSDPAAHG